MVRGKYVVPAGSSTYRPLTSASDGRVKRSPTSLWRTSRPLDSAAAVATSLGFLPKTSGSIGDGSEAARLPRSRSSGPS